MPCPRRLTTWNCIHAVLLPRAMCRLAQFTTQDPFLEANVTVTTRTQSEPLGPLRAGNQGSQLVFKLALLLQVKVEFGERKVMNFAAGKMFVL